MKKCTKCGIEKQTTEFHKDKIKKDGLRSYCKICASETAKKYREANPEKSREHTRKWQKANPEKHRKRERKWRESNPKKFRAITKKTREKYPEKNNARNKFRSGIRAGKIIRPTNCSRCDFVGMIEGHHYDYSKPFDVIWLCRKCHAKEHIRLRELEENNDEYIQKVQ